MKTVKELIIELLEYNLDAKVSVISKNKAHPFHIVYGTSEGSNKKNAEEVSFYVDSINGQEKPNK